MTLLSSLLGAAFTLATAYLFGSVILRKRSAPPELALGVGAVVESLLVFAMLSAGVAVWGTFLAMGAAAAALRVWLRPAKVDLREPIRCGRWGIAIFAAFGLWYLVNALAPETAPDGITYHLGLPREYVRLGGFPEHITFYDMVPQGMEMLYTVAYAFGRHAAAKLVEFAFFVATVPLMLRIGARLAITPTASLAAAIFYFCAPVAGLTGSSSYNDAAGVFFALGAFYLLLGEDERHLIPAGLMAGFCFAIKLPGVTAVACALLYGLARKRRRAAAVVCIAALAVMAPWIVRNVVLTGNPLAPLGNAIFPNPYFHIATETDLARGLRSLRQVQWFEVPWQLAFGDVLTGTFGPVIFALPLGLLALRRRTGRMAWAAAAILALPWLTNSGARFLMPAVAVAGFALAMALPPRLLWAAIAVQAGLSWPHVLDRFTPYYTFRLHEFPVRAALGIETEAEYCKRHFDEYTVARMIQRATPPDARTLALVTVANAYLDRDVAVSWQSAEADRLLDTLRLASVYSGSAGYDWRIDWPALDVRALRFRVEVGYPGEWDLNEVQVFSGEYRIFNSPQWTFPGWPNRWEAPLAFDGNLATRWRTWEPVSNGMYFEVDFGHAQRLSAAVLTTHTPEFRPPLEVWGREPRGEWRLLARGESVVQRASRDIRLDASRALRTAGFRYLLLPTGTGGNAPIGNAVVGKEAEWGMEMAAEAGEFHLLRVK